MKAVDRTFDTPGPLKAQSKGTAQPIFAVVSPRTALVDTSEKSRLTQRLLDRQSGAHVGKWHLDLRSGVLFWSDEMLTIMGENKDGPPIRKPDGVWGFVHPSDRVPLQRIAAAAEKQRQAYAGRYRVIRRIGGVRWVEVVGRFEYDALGQAARHWGTIRDVTAPRPEGGYHVRS